MSDSRKTTILLTVADLVIDLLDDGRVSDDDLPSGEIEESIEAGEVTVDEIVAEFRRALVEQLG